MVSYMRPRPSLAFIYLFNFDTIKLFLSVHVCTNIAANIFHHEPLYDGCEVEVDVDGNETIVTMSYVLRSGMTMMMIIINRSTFGCDANQKSVDEICCLQQQQKTANGRFFRIWMRVKIYRMKKKNTICWKCVIVKFDNWKFWNRTEKINQLDADIRSTTASIWCVSIQFIKKKSIIKKELENEKLKQLII